MFVKTSRKHHCEICGRALSNRGSQTFLFRDQNPGRQYVIFGFLQRPKVSSTISVSMRKYQKRMFSMLCARDIHSRRAASRLKKSAGWPLNCPVIAMSSKYKKGKKVILLLCANHRCISVLHCKIDPFLRKSYVNRATVFAKINAHPEISAHQKLTFQSTQNR